MISIEAKRIVKVLKNNPNAHVHYHGVDTWSIYIDKKTFDTYWQNGNGDKDLSEIELMEGSDFDSDYLSPLMEALLAINNKTGSSV